MLVNKSKFSKLAGVSRVAITKACKNGALVVRPDGKLDPENPVNQDYVKRNQSKSRKNKQAIAKSKEQSKPKQKTTIKSDKEPQSVSELVNNLDIESVNVILGSLVPSDLNKLKVVEQIRKLQVETQKVRQELVARLLVQKVFAKLYMIDVNEWRTLGANLSPEIAAIAGIDDNEVIIKIGEVIEKEVFVILQHIKRIMDDFLKSIEGDKVG